MKKLLPVVLVIGLFISSERVLAYERGVVKGESNVVVVENFKLSSGPGFFLPSSPLYFLDLFVNEMKVKLASSPSEEVRRRGAVAAERLAELKIALEANNPKGIDTALSNLTEHLDGIRSVFVKEKAAGRDVSKLAEETLAKLTSDGEALQALMTASENVTAKKLEAVELATSEAQDSVIEALPNLTREKERLKKLNRDALKDAKEAEKLALRVNQNAKQALKEANKSLKLRFGDEQDFATESMVLDDAVLRPFEDSIEQSDKVLEEASKSMEMVKKAGNFDPEKTASPSSSDVVE
jgi:hypothetical protein